MLLGSRLLVYSLKAFFIRSICNASEELKGPFVMIRHLVPKVILVAVFIVLFFASFQAQAVSSGNAANGLTAYSSRGCDGCHDSSGIGDNYNNAIYNAANASDVINRAITNNYGGQMAAQSATTVTQRNDIAAYLASLLPTQTAPAAAYITARSFTLNKIIVNDTGKPANERSFTSIVTAPGGSPAKGSVSYSTAADGTVTVTYTPAVGEVGADSFTYRASGSGTQSNDRTVNLSITTPAAASGFSLSNLTGTGGSFFSSQVLIGGVNATTSAGITSYALASGVLPLGVNLNSSTGVISGTPTQSGTFNITVSATKNAGNTGTSGPLSIVINQKTPEIITAPPTGTKDVPYLFTPTSNARFCGTTPATPTACTWSFSGTPPAGLSINSASGAITGTPTGFGSFAIQVQNSVGTATAGFVIANAPPVFSTASLPSGNTGVAYSTTVVASNAPAYTITSGALPAGLGLNSTTGVISGTPTAAGTFPFTITASNGVAPNATLLTSITIALSSPLITSPSTASVIEGQAFSTYQITSASAISSFSCPDCATNLPTGLSFNSTTGQITGTPVQGTARATPYNVTLQATNTTATASLPLAITVSFAKPVTSDRTAFTVPANAVTPIDLTSSITGTSAQVNIVTPPSEGAIAVSGNVVTFTPATDFLGAVSFTYTATAPSPGGQTSDTPAFSTVSFNVVPVPLTVSNATLNVPLNTPTSLDLSSFISGTGLSGVSVVTAPSHGAISVNGKVVTYVPVHDYFGADSFSYQAFGSAGTSQPATVTINIVGRPDPRQNKNVMATLNSQTDAAKRFSRAQVTNFQQRTELLHSRRSSQNAGSDEVADFNKPLTPELSSAAKIAAIGEQLSVSSQQSNELKAAAPVMLAYQDAPASTQNAAGASDQKLAALGNTLVSILSTQSINLAGLTSAVGDGAVSNELNPIEIWIMGNISFGARDAGGGAALSSFRTNGVTIGADKRFSDSLVLGAGVGYARERTDIGDDGSKSLAKGVSAAVYASYMPTDKVFIDALLGYGRLDFDGDRFVAPANDFARLNRSGSQVFGSLTTGYEYRKDGLLFSPYTRLNMEYNRLDAATEIGAGLNALNFSEQTTRTGQLSMGLRAEATNQIDGGLSTPHVRVELQGNFDRNGSSSIRYADQLNVAGFNLSSSNNSSRGILLGIGNDFILNNGVRLAFEYQTLRGEGNDNSQSINFRLSKELGGGVFQQQLIDNAEIASTRLGIRVDAGYTFDDNLTRAENAIDKQKDSSFNIRVSKGGNIKLTEHARIVLNGFVAGERFNTYRGLENVSTGLQGELQYRSSGEFTAPTFGVFAKTSYEEFESKLRDGVRYSAGISLRKPWTDRITLFTALGYNVRNSKSVVFDTKDTSARFNIDYMLTKKSALYFSGEYRHGDTLSSGTPSLKNADLALSGALEADDVFTNPQLTNYRFKGHSYLTTLGYNLPLGAKDSLDFSWRRIQSSPDDDPSYITDSTKYIVNQYSIVYLVRF